MSKNTCLEFDSNIFSLFSSALHKAHRGKLLDSIKKRRNKTHLSIDYIEESAAFCSELAKFTKN